jgi:predicted adenine nucleotide alpha hydrolase (AANH) superfamily ATPase
MSTVIHADGIKTVIHTSQWKNKARLNFLLRAGMSEQRVKSIEEDWEKDVQQAHAAEHARIVGMIQFLRDECKNPERAEMYRQEYLA